MSDHIPLVSRTVPITADNLPDGPLWEEDGACWKATPMPYAPGWRWGPLNWKALAKGEPQGPMTDHIPFKRGDEPPKSGGRAETGTSENG